MRPLEEAEIQQVFEKLFKFVGKNLKNIVDRTDQPHCFRLHKKVRARASAVALALLAHRPFGRTPSAIVFFLWRFWSKQKPACERVLGIWVGDDEDISALPNGSG